MFLKVYLYIIWIYKYFSLISLLARKHFNELFLKSPILKLCPCTPDKLSKDIIFVSIYVSH